MINRKVLLVVGIMFSITTYLIAEESVVITNALISESLIKKGKTQYYIDFNGNSLIDKTEAIETDMKNSIQEIDDHLVYIFIKLNINHFTQKELALIISTVYKEKEAIQNQEELEFYYSIGRKLSMSGVHPLVGENLVFLPSSYNNPVKVSKITYYKNKQIESVVIAEEINIQMPNGICCSIGKQGFGNTIVFLENGDMLWCNPNPGTVITLYSGEQADVSYITFGKKDKMFFGSVNFYSIIYLMSPIGDVLPVKQIMYFDNKQIKYINTGDNTRVDIFINGQKYNTQFLTFSNQGKFEKIGYFNENSKLLELNINDNTTVKMDPM